MRKTRKTGARHRGKATVKHASAAKSAHRVGAGHHARPQRRRSR